MSDLITAYTKPDPAYPGYVNVMRLDDGSVVVTVRGDPISPASHPGEGKTVRLSLSDEEWSSIAAEIGGAK